MCAEAAAVEMPVPDMMDTWAYEWHQCKTIEERERLTDRLASRWIIHPEIHALNIGRSTLDTCERAWLRKDSANAIWLNRKYTQYLLHELNNYKQLRLLNDYKITFLNTMMRTWLTRLENDTQVHELDRSSHLVTNAIATDASTNNKPKQATLMFRSHILQRLSPLQWKRTTVLGSRKPYSAYFDCYVYLDRDCEHSNVIFVAADMHSLMPPTMIDSEMFLFQTYINFEITV